jgi:hypothetical protein
VEKRKKKKNNQNGPPLPAVCKVCVEMTTFVKGRGRPNVGGLCPPTTMTTTAEQRFVHPPIKFARNLDTGYDLLKVENRPGGWKKKMNNHSCSVCGNDDDEQRAECRGRGKPEVVERVYSTRGEPTPSTLTLVAEKSLTRPLPLREIRA